jgi:hypothetical protein
MDFVAFVIAPRCATSETTLTGQVNGCSGLRPLWPFGSEKKPSVAGEK